MGPESGGIVGMHEVIESDFACLHVETKTNEATLSTHWKRKQRLMRPRTHSVARSCRDEAEANKHVAELEESSSPKSPTVIRSVNDSTSKVWVRTSLA